jgi:FtsP/CotA-like multicopper oxidase with cupredoxin domain
VGETADLDRKDLDMPAVTVPIHDAPSRPPRRRGRYALLAVSLLLLPVVVLGGAAAAVWVSAITDTGGEVAFSNQLAIPPLAESRVDPDGRRVFDLTLQRGRTDFGLGGSSETWGVDADHLGPTLRARRGEEVLVHVTNDVGEPTTLHWHGMDLPAAMDGGPHQVIAPGGTWSPTWTVDQPAATLWYHPHLHGRTAEHVHRGLVGLFLVDDQTRDLSLPSSYGVDDVPVMVTDRRFTAGGEIDQSGEPFRSTGLLGDTVLVNGTVGPYLDVTTERIRLRILNASPARVYDFGLDDGAELAVVASDGGLLPAPFRTDRIRLSPGERAEVVVTMTPGEERVLRSHPTRVASDPWSQRMAGGDDTLDILQLRAAGTLDPSPPLPDRLAAAPDLDRDLTNPDAAPARIFRMSGTNINGRDMDPSRIDEVVTVGETEIWEIRHADGQPHNVHLHGTQFQVLDVDGRPPVGHEAGWKDTLFLSGGDTVRLAVRFTGHTDPVHPYMIHCHLLQHEDRGMMAQFVVVEPGQQAGTPSAEGATSPHRGH